MAEEDVPQQEPSPALPRFHVRVDDEARWGAIAKPVFDPDDDIGFDDFAEVPLPDDPAEAVWEDEPEGVEDAAPPGRRRHGGLLAGLFVAVIAIGAGFASQPWRAPSNAPSDPAPAPTLVPAAPARLQVALAPVEPAVVPVAPVLAPAAAAPNPRPVAKARLASAPESTTRRSPAAPPPVRSAERAGVQAAYSTPTQQQSRVPDPAPVAAVAVLSPPPDPQEPERDPCYFAKSRTDRVVCTRPALAAIDRRLTRTYEAALGSSARADELQAEQQDWLRIRERAARRSPEALETVYRQRLEELEHPGAPEASPDRR